MSFRKTNDSLEIFSQEKYLHKTDHEDVRMTRKGHETRVKQKHVRLTHTPSDKSVFYIYKVDCYFFMFHVCIGTLITSSQASILRVRSFEKANKQFS